MGVHLHTGMFRAINETGWWGLTIAPKMEFTASHLPLAMSAYGRKTLRRWMRAGYCDTPGGEAAKRWELLMIANGARHITTHSRTGWFSSRVIQEMGSKPWVPDVEKFSAILALWCAAENIPNFQGTVGLVSETTHDRWMIHDVQMVHKTLSSTFMVSPIGYCNVLGTHQKGARAIVRTLVRELGHPLADLDAALDSIDQPCTFRVVTTECDCGEKAPNHSTHTAYYNEVKKK